MLCRDYEPFSNVLVLIDQSLCFKIMQFENNVWCNALYLLHK